MNVAYICSSLLALVALSVPALAASDVVSEWNQQAGICALEAKQNAPFATRTLAMVHTAMFDAINSVEGRYTPYKFKAAAAPGSSAEAAGVAAAHAVLEKLFPDQKSAIDATYTASLAKIPEGSGKTAGIAIGEEIAAKILAEETSSANSLMLVQWRSTPGAVGLVMLSA